MTNNQHGQVPEALQLADEISKAGAFPAYPRAPYEAAAAELRRLHAENEALRTAHVRGPAEIEHVAGDVSKNGAESNMAQQPAPSAAAHVGDSLFESWFSEYNPAHRGTKQQMRDAYAAGMGDPKAQPSLTPQADSQPGDKDLVAVPRDLIGAACSAIDKKRDGARTLAELRRYTVGDLSAAITSAPQADSQPAPEYVGNGMFKGETIQKAAEHWANWCDRRCMNGLAEFLRVVAARAPADSVTAPAGPSKSLPYEPTSAMLIAARERDPALPIETVRAIYWSMWRTVPTPPAQAADSVTAPAGCGAVVEWHAPGLGEVHNESHGQLIFCTDGDDVADDTLARRVCAALNATPAATPSAASLAWTALRDLTDPLGEAGVKIMGHVRIYAQRQYEAGLTEGRATLPIHAAGNVLEDAGGANWQDISTAPKDGTRFVAVGNNYGLYSEGQHTCIAQWFRGCWMDVSEWNETSELKYLTHWMPLLPLPGTAARKQGGA